MREMPLSYRHPVAVGDHRTRVAGVSMKWGPPPPPVLPWRYLSGVPGWIHDLSDFGVTGFANFVSNHP